MEHSGTSNSDNDLCWGAISRAIDQKGVKWGQNRNEREEGDGGELGGGMVGGRGRGKATRLRLRRMKRGESVERYRDTLSLSSFSSFLSHPRGVTN